MGRPDDAGDVPDTGADEGLDDATGSNLLRLVKDVEDEQLRLQLLMHALVTVAAELSIDGVLRRIVSVASTLVGAQYAALAVVDEGTDRRLRTFVHHGMSTEVVTAIGELPRGHGLLGVLIDDPRPLRLGDLATHAASSGFPEHHPPMRSFLGVPLRIRDKVYGNLYLTEKVGGGAFTEEDERVGIALAAAAGVAIQNARLYEKAEQRQAWLEATTEIVAQLAAEPSTQQALQGVADRARTLSGADVTWVAVGSRPRDLHLEVVSGPTVDLDALRRLPMRKSLASLVLRTGEPVVVEDLATDARAVDPSSVEGWPRLGPVMVVPLRSGTGVHGVLALGWQPHHAEAFREVDPALPASFAEQASLAIQLARARDDQQRLSLFEDRDRIARDLHDLVIQRLFAVGLGLQRTARTTSEADVTRRLEQAVDDIDDTIKDIRRTIFSLGSPGGGGDVQAEVERLVSRAAGTLKLHPTLRVEGPLRSLVGPDLASDLLAVLGELLTNVGRHAEATAVQVLVSVADDVVVRVRDDGRGMGEEILEGGLANLRQRARIHGGRLRVQSRPGAGTTVTWRVPLEREGAT
jgi:signal transduction histidine kinase